MTAILRCVSLVGSEVMNEVGLLPVHYRFQLAERDSLVLYSTRLHYLHTCLVLAYIFLL
jgi:hypothetical protein